jgi:hypothetical protein
MKEKINSKNPLRIFAIFFIYLFYLIIRLIEINIFSDSLFCVLFLIYFLIKKYRKNYLFIPLFFSLSLIVFKIIIYFIKFNKDINLSDLYYYLNFNLIIFYFNSFIFSYILINSLETLALNYVYSKYLKNLFIYPKIFFNLLKEEILDFQLEVQKKVGKEKLLKKRFVFLIDYFISFLERIIVKTYKIWRENLL